VYAVNNAVIFSIGQ